MGLLDTYLDHAGTTRYQVAKANGVTPSKLQRASTYETIDGITTRVILYVAKALGKTPGTVLDEMIALESQTGVEMGK
jgi:hypothetical protein